jgi:hypothetical protein
MAYATHIITNYFVYFLSKQGVLNFIARVSVSEWLRRWTRNPLGYARVGSNPAADYEHDREVV